MRLFETKNCMMCGNVFNQTSSNYRLKFCSHQCYSKYRSINKHLYPTKNRFEVGRFQYSGDKNPAWKGDGVGYTSLHTWVKRRFPKSDVCDFCHAEEFLELSNKSGHYKRDLEDWQWLCRKCHKKYDKVGEKASVTRKIQNLKFKKDCLFSGCENITMSKVQLCTSHWRLQWIKKQQGKISNLNEDMKYHRIRRKSLVALQ